MQEPKGIPYTLTEAQKVVSDHTMDPYHRELMQWLIDRLNHDETAKAIDLITASLALPIDAKPEDIAKAVRMCTRRCEELEHEVIRLQTEDRPLSPREQLNMMEARIAKLEAFVRSIDGP